MQTRPIEVRQSLGCGYAEAPTHFPIVPWQHVGYQRHADEIGPKGETLHPVCVGYVCSLPEVIEATHAAAWKRDGELTQWCEGQVTSQMRDAIAVLEIEQRRAESWSMANPEKK